MTENYKEMLEKGREYEDFISIELLKALAIPLMSFSSAKYQYGKGENMQGFEIKFDDKFKETGNLYIEYAEKGNPENPLFVASGIYRADKTWIYLIGDYKEVFFLPKVYLGKLHQSKKYKEVETATSKGYLLPREDAEKYKIHKLTF